MNQITEDIRDGAARAIPALLAGGVFYVVGRLMPRLFAQFSSSEVGAMAGLGVSSVGIGLLFFAACVAVGSPIVGSSRAGSVPERGVLLAVSAVAAAGMSVSVFALAGGFH